VPETVLITGGTAGLGRALVKKWLAEGWNVATCARSQDAREILRDEYNSEQLFARAVDVSDRYQVTEFVQEITKKWGTIDVLINNASILGPRVEILDYPPDEWDEVMRVNLDGTINFCRAVAPQMAAARSGVILNISSGAGIKGKERWGAYAVSKFAIEGFTQVLREELSEHRVRVHAIDPDKMRTKMRADAYPDEDPMTLRTPEKVADVIFDIAAVFEPQLGRLSVTDYL
jgi:NAD(P)-dependent dehydrogenase (short-subunit alcohol dehydrogenase family)